MNTTSPPPLPAGTLPSAEVMARLGHLFRAARRAGQIHPLEHLIQRHRSQPAPPGDTR